MWADEREGGERVRTGSRSKDNDGIGSQPHHRPNLARAREDGLRGDQLRAAGGRAALERSGVRGGSSPPVRGHCFGQLEGAPDLRWRPGLRHSSGPPRWLALADRADTTRDRYVPGPRNGSSSWFSVHRVRVEEARFASTAGAQERLSARVGAGGRFPHLRRGRVPARHGEAGCGRSHACRSREWTMPSRPIGG